MIKVGTNVKSKVHDILEDIKVQHERKLQAARAKQPKAEW